MFDVSKRIIELREEREWSQAQLARKANLSQGSLSNIESGKKQPTITMMDRICAGFGIGLHEFFMPEDYHVDMRIVNTAKKILSLRDEQRDFLLRGIDLLNDMPEPPAPIIIEVEKEVFKEPEDTGHAFVADFITEKVQKNKLRRHLPVLGDKKVFLGAEDTGIEDIPNGAQFGLCMDDDSMDPRLPMGCVAWIQQTPILANNQLGAFFIDGKPTCRKLILHNNSFLLIPMNPAFPPILIEDYDTLDVIGKVLND